MKLMFPPRVGLKVHPSYWAIPDSCLEQVPDMHSVICHVVCPWRLHLDCCISESPVDLYFRKLSNPFLSLFILLDCITCHSKELAIQFGFIVYFKRTLLRRMLPGLPVMSNMNNLLVLYIITDYYWISFSHLLR